MARRLPPSLSPLSSLAKLLAQTRALELAALFDSLDDVQFWIKSCDGRYLHVNQAFLLNYNLHAVEQVAGKTDHDLSPRFLADAYRLDDDQVARGRRVANRVELVGELGQTPRWFVTNKIPLRDARRRIVATAGTTRPLPAASTPAHDAFLEVVLYMRDRFQLAHSNAQLARRAHLSVRSFERRFRADFHATPQEYLRRLRVLRACRMLTFDDKSLLDVAHACGYAGLSHMTHEFRRHGMPPPGRYRSAQRPGS
jgi:AraC-like DNA-binding protein